VDFLHDIQGQARDVVKYLQRLLGYGITGRSSESVYPVLWGGGGRNGKTVLLETLAAVLGEDLAYKAPASFVLQSKFQAPAAGADASLMKMRGKRIVWCSETNEGDRIDAAKIKELSGNDSLSGRSPYDREQSTFRPSHLLLLLTNNRPKMPASDPALWHRVHLIPFLFTYIPNPDPKNPFHRQQDPAIKDRLRTTKSKEGILAWLVRGCLEYQQQGLNPPESVLASTREYQEHEDRTAEFLGECCVVDSSARVRITDVFKRYQSWCKECGYIAAGRKKFFDDMQGRFEHCITDGYKVLKVLREVVF